MAPTLDYVAKLYENLSTGRQNVFFWLVRWWKTELLLLLW